MAFVCLSVVFVFVTCLKLFGGSKIKKKGLTLVERS